MNYSGSQYEKTLTAGELDRSHVGQTVSFQPNGRGAGHQGEAGRA